MLLARPCSRRRQVHRGPQVRESCSRDADHAASGPVEVESHEEQERDEPRREQDCDRATAEDGEVDREQPEGHRGRGDLQPQDRGRHAIVQAGDADRLQRRRLPPSSQARSATGGCWCRCSAPAVRANPSGTAPRESEPAGRSCRWRWRPRRRPRGETRSVRPPAPGRRQG